MALLPLATSYFTPTDDLNLLHELGRFANAAGMTAIESYDGTTREVPAGGDLDNSANQWQSGGTLAAGSWLVLRTNPGLVATSCDIFLRAPTGTSLQSQMFPLGDWVTGLGTDASPTKPTVQTALATFSVTSKTDPRSFASNGSMLAFITHNKSDATQNNTYLGEVRAAQNTVDDPRPFVHGSNSLNWAAGWSRISPFDDTTVLTVQALADTDMVPDPTAPFPADFIPVKLSVTTASHRHVVGVPYWIAHSPPETANTSYTYGESLGVRDWCAFRNSGSYNRAIAHDGTVLDTDLLRTELSPEIDPPAGYALVRRAPFMARARP